MSQMRHALDPTPRGAGTMTLQRAWRLDLSAFVLLVAGLLVASALFSHDPGTVYPPSRPSNLLGDPGDLVARELVATLGVAVYVWLAAWFVFVLLLYLRRRWWVWLRRFAGWLLLVPVVALAAHRHGENIPSI